MDRTLRFRVGRRRHAGEWWERVVLVGLGLFLALRYARRWAIAAILPFVIPIMESFFRWPLLVVWHVGDGIERHERLGTHTRHGSGDRSWSPLLNNQPWATVVFGQFPHARTWVYREGGVVEGCVCSPPILILSWILPGSLLLSFFERE